VLPTLKCKLSPTQIVLDEIARRYALQYKLTRPSRTGVSLSHAEARPILERHVGNDPDCNTCWQDATAAYIPAFTYLRQQIWRIVAKITIFTENSNFA
jgi:hypothetical protein